MTMLYFGERSEEPWFSNPARCPALEDCGPSFLSVRHASCMTLNLHYGRLDDGLAPS